MLFLAQFSRTQSNLPAAYGVRIVRGMYVAGSPFGQELHSHKDSDVPHAACEWLAKQSFL